MHNATPEDHPKKPTPPPEQQPTIPPPYDVEKGTVLPADFPHEPDRSAGQYPQDAEGKLSPEWAKDAEAANPNHPANPADSGEAE